MTYLIIIPVCPIFYGLPYKFTKRHQDFKTLDRGVGGTGRLVLQATPFFCILPHCSGFVPRKMTCHTYFYVCPHCTGSYNTYTTWSFIHAKKGERTITYNCLYLVACERTLWNTLPVRSHDKSKR